MRGGARCAVRGARCAWVNGPLGIGQWVKGQ
jgi:hypothetical protein